jgi:hypothetical protein
MKWQIAGGAINRRLFYGTGKSEHRKACETPGNVEATCKSLLKHDDPSQKRLRSAFGIPHGYSHE